MIRQETLKQNIEHLYRTGSCAKVAWVEWLFANHVFVVADTGEELAKRFGANALLAWSAGALHDVADAVLDRFEPGHMEESMRIARELLRESEFTESEIAIVVDDAIRFHSCHGVDLPQTLEGKVMATADAVVHLTTGYYPYMLERKQETMTPEEVRTYILAKIERDYREKIFFDEVRREVTEDYEKAKSLLKDVE